MGCTERLRRRRRSGGKCIRSARSFLSSYGIRYPQYINSTIDQYNSSLVVVGVGSKKIRTFWYDKANHISVSPASSAKALCNMNGGYWSKAMVYASYDARLLKWREAMEASVEAMEASVEAMEAAVEAMEATIEVT